MINDDHCSVVNDVWQQRQAEQLSTINYQLSIINYQLIDKSLPCFWYSLYLGVATKN